MNRYHLPDVVFRTCCLSGIATTTPVSVVTRGPPAAEALSLRTSHGLDRRAFQAIGVPALDAQEPGRSVPQWRVHRALRVEVHVTRAQPVGPFQFEPRRAAVRCRSPDLTRHV